MRTTTRVAGVLAGLTLTLGSIGVAATAEAEPAAPCTQQQHQVDRATDALARVTAVFEKQGTKVKHARHDVRAADTAAERARAERHLARVQENREHAKAEKKAQRQRLAKAQARLSACQDDQPASS